MSKLSPEYQDCMQDKMIRAQEQARRNAHEWLRRAQVEEDKLKGQGLSLPDRVRILDMVDALREQAMSELRGLPLELGNATSTSETKRAA